MTTERIVMSLQSPPGQPKWRKAASSGANGNCVELAAMPGASVAVRDSKHPAGPVLKFSRAEMAAFLDGAKNGEFDDLC